MASGFGFGAPSSQVGQAFFEGGDFAEPDVVAGFGQSGFGGGGYLLESSELGGVDAEAAASGAGLTEMILNHSARRCGVRCSRMVTGEIPMAVFPGVSGWSYGCGGQPGLDRPVEARRSGMPRWTVAVWAVRMASSFWAAAAMVVSIAATSPSLWGARR